MGMGIRCQDQPDDISSAQPIGLSSEDMTLNRMNPDIHPLFKGTATQYYASFQHGIAFNFQLCTYPLFKHWLPIHPWISVFHLTIIIKQPSLHSHQSTCPIQMTSHPYGPLWHWDGRPLQAQTYVPSSWHSPYGHSSLLDRPFNASSASSWHFLLFLSFHLWYPLWFPSLHQMISQSLPSFLPTHYFLHVYNPRDHFIWERTSW